MMNRKAVFKDTDMQAAIGWVLRIGVIVSISVVIIGGVIFLYRHGHEAAGHQQFKGIPIFIQHIGGIVKGVLALRGQAIIQMGIILLIATPVLRVVFSAIGFVLEKDHLYTGISVLVLLIIIISMISGQAG